MNSCQKGKRGERLWRDQLINNGYTDARRGQQFSGSPESPDVICESLKQFHFEVKNTERLNLSLALSQSIGDSGTDQIPLVCSKRNGEDWIVSMRASDWFQMIKKA